MASWKFKLCSNLIALLNVTKEGSFGTEWMSWKKDTKEFVAAKIPKDNSRGTEEEGHFVHFDVYLVDCIVKSTVSSM